MRQRKILRLKHYDYSSNGAYFVTICIHQHACLFGNIVSEQMVLNDAGLMVQKYYFALASRFSNIKCGDHVIMPNHFHCIIHMQNDQNNIEINQYIDSKNKWQIVGADLCVGPGHEKNKFLDQGEHTGSPLQQQDETTGW